MPFLPESAILSSFKNWRMSSSYKLKMESVEREISALLFQGMLESTRFDSLRRESLFLLALLMRPIDNEPSSPKVCSSFTQLSSSVLITCFLLPVLVWICLMLLFLPSPSSSSIILSGESNFCRFSPCPNLLCGSLPKVSLLPTGPSCCSSFCCFDFALDLTDIDVYDCSCMLF